MAIYVIGDVQGCYDELQRLLTKINFNQNLDCLWFTGDLVNRGAKSLETLRFVKTLGDSAVVVLGNHDLHLLACFYGGGKTHKSDTLDAIFSAEDCGELLNWLRHRPLFHYQHNFCLVHAGLPPQWDLSLTQQCAEEVERVLRHPDKARHLFNHMYGDNPNTWDEDLEGWPMIRFILNAFTRMRYCALNGAIDVKYKGGPGSQPPELIPWFNHPDRKSRNLNILFGHWSTLGLINKKGIYSLDTGCLWGGYLTALKLNDNGGHPIQVSCECLKKPKFWPSFLGF